MNDTNQAMNDALRRAAGHQTSAPTTPPAAPAQPAPAGQREPYPAIYELFLIAPHLFESEPEPPKKPVPPANAGNGVNGRLPAKTDMNHIIRQAAGLE